MSSVVVHCTKMSWLVVLKHMYICAQTYTHTHTHTHTHATYTYKYTRAYALSILSCHLSQPYAHRYISDTFMDTYIHTHATHTYKYTHVRMRYPFLPVIYHIIICTQIRLCTHTASFSGLPRFVFRFEFIYYTEVEE